MTNQFVKTTKYMIQESKHYMDRQKVHKSSATSLDLEPDTKKPYYKA
jgi:hypothetical protein